MENIDKKAYEILQSNLDEVIKEIRITKQEENIEDSLDVNKYKKSLKLNELINMKDIMKKHLLLFIQNILYSGKLVYIPFIPAYSSRKSFNSSVVFIILTSDFLLTAS